MKHTLWIVGAVVAVAAIGICGGLVLLVASQWPLIEGFKRSISD